MLKLTSLRRMRSQCLNWWSRALDGAPIARRLHCQKAFPALPAPADSRLSTVSEVVRGPLAQFVAEECYRREAVGMTRMALVATMWMQWDAPSLPSRPRWQRWWPGQPLKTWCGRGYCLVASRSAVAPKVKAVVGMLVRYSEQHRWGLGINPYKTAGTRGRGASQQRRNIQYCSATHILAALPWSSLAHSVFPSARFARESLRHGD